MIKKMIVNLGILAIVCASGVAQASVSPEEAAMCMQAPYPVSSKFSQGFSRFTGSNFVASNLAEHQMTRTFKKLLGSDVDVKFELYSVGDFASGKFKSMSAKSDKMTFNGISISDFRAKTVCDFNYIKPYAGKIVFPANFLLAFESKITPEDLQSIINAQDLSAYDLSVGKLTVFKVLSTQATIVNNRINIKSKLIHPFTMFKAPAEVSIDAGLRAQNGDIVFSDVKFNSSDNKISMNTILPLLNKFKPLEQEVEIMPGAKAKVIIKNIEIVDNVINITGLSIVPKNYK